MKNIEKRHSFFIVLFFVALFLSALPNGSFAAEVDLPGLGSDPTFPQYVAYIFYFAVGLATSLAFLAIVLGGIYWLASLGMGKFKSEGKAWVKAGVLGLLIILSSWVILYAINPDLVSFKDVSVLPIPIPIINIVPDAWTKTIPSITYNEIPVGMLTENLLTRTMDCYEFNDAGDPIDGDPETEGWEPTLLNHDRIDCLLKLAEAANKKAEVFTNLSEAIANLMDTCSCKEILEEEEFVFDYEPEGNQGDKTNPVASIEDLFAPTLLQENTESLASLIMLAADDSCDPGDVKWCASCARQQCNSSGQWGSCVKFNFSISVSPASASVSVGDPATATVTITVTSPSYVPSYNVYLSAQGVPLYGGTSFSPSSCAPNCSSTMTINTRVGDRFATAKDFNITIKGSACGEEKTTNFALEVLPREPLGLNAEGLGEMNDTQRMFVTWGKGVGAQETRVTRGGVEIYFGRGTWRIDEGLNPDAQYCYEARSWSCSLGFGYDHLSCSQAGGHNHWSVESASTCNDPNTEIKGECKSVWGGKCSYYRMTTDPSTCNSSICDVKGTCACNPNPPCDAPCPEGVKDKIDHGPIILEACGEETKEYKGLDEFRGQHTNILGFTETEIVIEGRRIKAIKKDAWEELRLIDQLKYLNEKIKQIKGEIEKDTNILESAESALSQYYFVKPYVELLRLMEGTDDGALTVDINEPFRDPVTNQVIDISKYCSGFEYANSNCFHTCQNICPGANTNSLNALRTCSVNTQRLLSDTLTAQEINCLKTAFHQCPNSAPFDEFGECLTDCKEQCSALCDQKYASCSDKLESCKNECNNNSACLENNEGECYVSFVGLKRCADAANSFDEFKKCADEAFKCKYCSSEYAGYPDCLSLSKITGAEYSFSYLFQNQDKLKCQECYEEIETGSGSSGGNPPKSTCIELFPEASKCSPCSSCPKCPCEDIVEPGISYLYGLCNGQCGEYAYNDDPLTFYYRNDYWRELDEKSKFPLGEVRICSREDEIPVGQAVDGAEYWAKELMKLISDFVEKTEDNIKYLTQIGAEKNYCLCNSKCSSSENACEASCEYQQQLIFDTDPDTGETIEYWICYCVRKPCDNNPCQKLINMLRGKAADEKCPEGTEYKGVAWYAEEMRKSFEKLEKFSIEGRSEALKMLIYSRKKMDECSAKTKLFEGEVKLLNCERVEDEIIYPITYGKPIIGVNGQIITDSITSTKTSGRCYGENVGKILEVAEPLLDNWFCCEQRLK